MLRSIAPPTVASQGGGLVCSESAIHFLREGKDVTLVEMKDDFAGDANPFHKMGLNRELIGHADIKLGSTVKAITKDGIVITNGEGKEEVCQADTIFCAAGLRSKADEVALFSNKVMDFRAIGDCVKPGKAMDAIHHGYYAAVDL